MEKQRQKAEEQKLKQEEKERKAEEQRLKQEEKERKEEAEKAKALKAKAAFSNFFVKKSPEEKAKVAAAAEEEEARQDSNFSMFIVKKNMRLTPACRDAIQCCCEFIFLR